MDYATTGTITFLFSDIQGSTELLQQLGDQRYADVLEGYRRLLRTACAQGGGQEVDTQGDGVLVAFPRAREAVAAAVAAQRAILTQAWPERVSVRARMGLHTGEPLRAQTGYVGRDVHRAARICAVGHGGQILLSQTTRALVEYDLPDGVTLQDLGAYRLRGLSHSEHLCQVVHPALPGNFPPLTALPARPNNLPTPLTRFIGRTREIDEVKRLLPRQRLLTLTGSGGCGKTRLALEVAARVLDEFAHGVWVVELASLSDPALVPQAVAVVLGLQEDYNRPLVKTLADFLRAQAALLVLDNCEHVLPACARLVDALLTTCPKLHILATSQEALGLTGEVTYRVPSLSLPSGRPPASLDQLAGCDAVQLFIDRARARVPDLVVTDAHAPAIAAVCQQLDGIPLAIELAAARIKVLSVEQIAARLDDRFQLLTGGSRTALPRHQTLQAAMDWSYELLSEPERALWRRLSVFVGGFTLDAAEAICPDGFSRGSVLEHLTQLVEKSLIVVEHQMGGAPIPAPRDRPPVRTEHAPGVWRGGVRPAAASELVCGIRGAGGLRAPQC